MPDTTRHAPWEASNRHFGPHDDAERLPIYPVLLGETGPEALPTFLRLFQATHWNGSDTLPERLLDRIRERAIDPSEEAVFEDCPFVGLDAFKIAQARLFFGRQSAAAIPADRRSARRLPCLGP